jgi:SAM-dependent methyltransferase
MAASAISGLDGNDQHIVEFARAHEDHLDWTKRPTEIVEKISILYQDINSRNIDAMRWGVYRGSNNYHLLEIEDQKLIKKIILHAPHEQSEFYFLDIGAGDFSWSVNVESFIRINPLICKGKTFHIISMVGETVTDRTEEETLSKRVYNYCRSLFSSDAKINQYRFGSFKIEEIHLELTRRGLDLENRVDLIVSRYCFRHLVDPMGTFAQTYNLLKPRSGLALMDSFVYDFETASPQNTLSRMIQILRLTKSPFLIRSAKATRTVSQFILKRDSDRPCLLPIDYHSINTNPKIGRSFDAASSCICIYKKTSSEDDSWVSDYNSWCDFACFCDKILYGDKNLFDFLNENEFDFGRNGVLNQKLLWDEIPEDE